jgi:hypothetical protein
MGVANEGMRGFRDILDRYKAQHGLDLSYQIFDVRRKGQVPDTILMRIHIKRRAGQSAG